MKEWFCISCIQWLVGRNCVKKFDAYDHNVCAHCGLMRGKGKLMDRETLLKASKDPSAFVEKSDT